MSIVFINGNSHFLAKDSDSLKSWSNGVALYNRSVYLNLSTYSYSTEVTVFFLEIILMKSLAFSVIV